MNRTRETETSLYDDNQAKTYMGPVTEVNNYPKDT